MDELQLIRDFGAGTPGPTDASRRAARAALGARFERARPASWRRRGLLLVAAAIVLFVGAGAALALGDRIFDLVRGKPAPPAFSEVMARFHDQQGLPPEYRRRVEGFAIAGEWRGVLGMQTAVGPFAVWAAPTRNGGLCWQAVITDEAVTKIVLPVDGGCGPVDYRAGEHWSGFGPDTVPGPPEGQPLLWSNMRLHGIPQRTQRTQILFGRAAREVARIVVSLESGGTQNQIAARAHDSFVAAEAPPQAVPRSVRALDADGRPLGQAACEVSGSSGYAAGDTFISVDNYSCRIPAPRR